MKKFINFLALISLQSYSDEKNKLIFLSDFDTKDAFSNFLVRSEHIELVDKEGVKNSSAIKVSYVPYERGSKRVVKPFKLERAHKELTLCYDVKFDQDFDWARGGKLHGVGPINKITGGKAMQEDGWSVRLTFAPEGGLKSYVYNQSKTKKYGEALSLPTVKLKKERYYSVSIYTKVNTPNKNDGEVSYYIDGKLMLKLNKQTLRGKVKDSEALIEKILFSTFHGGHNPKNAPRVNGELATCYAYFDNFAAYRGLHVRKR